MQEAQELCGTMIDIGGAELFRSRWDYAKAHSDYVGSMGLFWQLAVCDVSNLVCPGQVLKGHTDCLDCAIMVEGPYMRLRAKVIQQPKA